jgi:hypothetical protein
MMHALKHNQFSRDGLCGPSTGNVPGLAKEQPAGEQQQRERGVTMKNKIMFSCAAALGLLAFGASNVQASDGVLQRVTINMTLTSQDQRQRPEVRDHEHQVQHG